MAPQVSDSPSSALFSWIQSTEGVSPKLQPSGRVNDSGAATP